ncbi:MAG TPA: MFS transporter [Caulobacteraceae bacterium]|nr:MFS transporter [Caulobacteraceae bacterium]
MTAMQGYVRARTRVGKVGFSTKVFQGIGALPDTFKAFAFGTLLLFYYNQVLGLPAFVASSAIAAALIIDAAVDPLVGSISDNLHSRLGRRHPFMYLSAAPLALGLFLAFMPPAHLSQGALTLWLFGSVVATHVSMSLFSVPWTALYAEFSDDYAERTAIVTYRYALGWIGGLAFTFLSWTLIFPSSPRFASGQLNPEAYRLFAPVVACCVLVTVLATTHLTRREIPYLLQPAARPPPFSFGRVVREILAACSNPEFLVLFVAALVSSGISGTTDALAIYIQTYFWGLHPEQLRWLGLAIFGAIAAFAAVGSIERLLDKKQVLLTCFALLLIDYMGIIGLRLAGLMPANGERLLLVILVANEIVRAFLLTVLLIMFASMLADTLDLQELRTGRRQEGIFAAALAFSGKATSGVGAFMAGLLLQHVIHWPAKAAAATDPALVTRLAVVGGLLAPTLFVIPFLLAARYSITRESHAETKAALDARRAAAGLPA